MVARRTGVIFFVFQGNRGESEASARTQLALRARLAFRLCSPEIRKKLRLSVQAREWQQCDTVAVLCQLSYQSQLGAGHVVFAWLNQNSRNLLSQTNATGSAVFSLWMISLFAGAA